jgi:hypothetical protein
MTDPQPAPPAEVYRATFEGDVITIDGQPYHATGWLDGRMRYCLGPPPALPPRPRPRPDDSIGAGMH